MSRRLCRIALTAAFAFALAAPSHADEHDSALGGAWRALWSWLVPLGGVTEPVLRAPESRQLEAGVVGDPYGRAQDGAPGDLPEDRPMVYSNG